MPFSPMITQQNKVISISFARWIVCVKIVISACYSIERKRDYEFFI